ncbi:hypothetical protein AB834_01745 [PVC group bacterium (ex Bugula neritina AB1)]|nr:hypothetical protein AB834_01745 [PVC group bacterium (ex Bugula neritina AB1)]
MISVIMAVKDNLIATRKGIDSILAADIEPIELIIINNGSLKETQKYLESINVTLINNKENKGCAYAWNQGIKASKGKYVCIVNNDIEVPHDWLKCLKTYLTKGPYALVSPAMREGELDYSLEEMNQTYREVFGGKVFEGEIRGTALFAEKDLFNKTGLFDESFRWGKYEDEDFFIRLKLHGLKTAVITDCCIHHYGSKTVNQMKKELPFDFEKINRKVFFKKWWWLYPWRKFNKYRIKMRHRITFKKTGLPY